jgi:hypothetical protein
MKDYWKEPKEKKINRKKIIIAIIIGILIISSVVTSIIYIKNKDVRNWIDKNILGKEISQNNLPTIEIDESKNQKIYAYSKYISVLSDNILEIYDGTGKKESELQVEITKPIFKSNNRHMVIAEEKGQKLYLITDKAIAWENTVNGNIAQVNVNKNGYVAVTIVDTSYKTVITMFDNEGNELFNTYLSTTRVASVSISNDNKYLALAEIDTSGTMIQSNIKIITIEEGKNNPKDSIKEIYNGENNDLITNIEYQEKDRLLCMYTDKIMAINTDGTIETIIEYKDKNVSFASVSLSNTSMIVEEKSSGLFTADSVVTIVNSENKNQVEYTTESVTKEIFTNNDVIALNLGTEVEIINTSGWLVKKYIAEQEINDVVLSNSIAGIIYRDKIEIINL